MSKSAQSGWKQFDPVFLDVFAAAVEILENAAPGIKEPLRIAIANRIALRAEKMGEERAARNTDKDGGKDGE